MVRLPSVLGTTLASPPPHTAITFTIGRRRRRALRDLAAHAEGLRPAPSVDVPPPHQLRLPQADLPHDAFFGPTEAVPLLKAAGRVAAEMLTPYPPGIPVVLPGEELNAAVLEYLRTGVDAGMSVPDARDLRLDTVRVVAES